MFDVQKPAQKPLTVIRAASGHELTEYEKQKLAGIEENAQENKLEFVKLNNQRLPIDKVNKEVNIELGNMATVDKITPKELSDDLFFIRCELDESVLVKNT